MAYVSRKKLSDGTIVLIGSNLYGVCNTASGTAEKSVAVAGFDVLEEGVTIHVYFVHKNTAGDPTLKVGTTEAKPIRRNGVGGKWEDYSVISFTYASGIWHQNDADDTSGTVYGLAYNASTKTLSLVEGGGGDSVVLPNDDTTYTLTKSGNTITLTGSDGSTASVTDENTEYGLSFNNGVLSLVRGGSDLTANIPDEDTTYTISISGDQLTLTPSSGTPQTITLPAGGLKYVEDVIANPETFGVVVNDVNGNTASGEYSVAEGRGTTASGNYSHAEGGYTTASGGGSHAEGYNTVASGSESHAEGSDAEAAGQYSHAEGYGTVASKHASHAEGTSTTASGFDSHAEGWSTTASGHESHAEGSGTTASGYASHAEGRATTASGENSHAQNQGTLAAKDNQTAIGKYNVEDTETVESKQKAFIIGNGTAYNARSNGFSVDWDGNVEAAGDYTDGSGNVLKPHVELTQAEYDALTQDEKENGNVYYITDGSPVPASLSEIFVDKDDALLNLNTAAAVTTTDGALYQALVNIGWTDVIE